MDRVGFAPRCLALLIDVLIVFPALGVFTIILFEAMDGGGHPAFWAALPPFVWLLYSSAEVFWAATPGKWLLGQRIAAADGSPADFWIRLLRWETKQLGFICQLLLALTAFLPFQLLGGFMNTVLLAGCAAALNDGSRAWHDEWARTSVVRRKRPTIPPPLSVAVN